MSHNPVFEAYLMIEREHTTCFTRIAPPAEMQQTLATQQPSSTGQAPRNGTAPAATPPASPADWCPLHQVAMEQRRNATGTWYSHWVANEQRYCKGKH